MKTREVRIEGERIVRTYSEFWHTSKCLLQMTSEIKEGSYHLCMASMVFAAFSLEAYLNHIGEKVLLCWEDLEKLSPKQKLKVISEKIGMEINFGERPWQVVEKIFQFRNDIAHGKNKTLRHDEKVSLEDFNKNPFNWKPEQKTRWEKYCTNSNAERAHVDIETIVRRLHVAANIQDERPFEFGLESAGATLIQ